MVYVLCIDELVQCFMTLSFVLDRSSDQVATATLEQGVEESTPDTGEGVKMDWAVPRPAVLIEALMLAAPALLLVEDNAARISSSGAVLSMEYKHLYRLTTDSCTRVLHYIVLRVLIHIYVIPGLYPVSYMM
jgi:hypothetical protein